MPIFILSFSVFGLWSSQCDFTQKLFSQTEVPIQSRKTYDEVLVFKNGQIVEGFITQDSRGYEVHQKDRSRFFALYGHVMFKAESRHDAYRKMKTRMPNKSAENHFRLATWCYSHELYADALTELRHVFQFDPDHRSARKLSELIEEKIAPASERTIYTNKLTIDGFLQGDLKSLAGLSSSSAKMYVSRIQPMLVRSCRSSGCHGEKSNQRFRLLKPNRRGNNRNIAERNLAQILRWIDPEHPQQSKLLSIPLESHGGKNRPIFEGNRGRKLHETLKQWIAMTVPPKNFNTESMSSLKNKSKTGNDTIARKDSRIHYSPPPALQRIKNLRDAGKMLSSSKKRTTKRDAFDPREFNKRNRK